MNIPTFSLVDKGIVEQKKSNIIEENTENADKR